MRFFVRGALLLLALFSLVSTFSPPAQATAAGLIVNTTADTNDGSCDPLGFGTGNQDCTLREAITAANANTPFAETITFSVSGTITLGSTLPAISDDLTIDSTGQTITVSGASTYRVMIVNGAKTLTVNALTIANGSVSDFGGGIFNSGTLDVTNSTFSGNSANGGLVLGGGIFNNSGTVTVTNSTFSGNSLTGTDDSSGGGGIYNNNGTVTVTDSTFSGNTSTKFGGGIANAGTLNVTNSTFSGNGAAGISGGGGIFNFSGKTLTVANSTFSGNSAPGASGGGGIRNDGTLNVTNSTFSANSANAGGGISNTNVATATLRNSIIANSTSGGDCFIQGSSSLSANSNNIDSDGTCDSATTKTTAQINLAALNNYGGPTQTMKLQSPSDALNTGDNTVCAAAAGSPNFGADGLDQRGAIRPQNTTCDVGAYELLFCPPGTYDDGGASCKLADLGYFVPVSGSIAQTACPPGTTSTVLGATYCKSLSDFVITVKTDNAGTSSSTEFTIPTTGGGYNYNVDCNDDNTNEATAQAGDYTCDYGATGLNTGAGTYTIRVKDNTGSGTGFPRIYFNDGGDKLKLLTIEQWGTGKWTSMVDAFFGCANLAGQASDNPDLSGVTDLGHMFRGASVFNQDISGWNTGSVTAMDRMFRDAGTFNKNIGGWDTTNVTDMTGMFFNASAFNQNIGAWDTGNVTAMSFMFQAASAFNQPIGAWDVSKVTNMQAMLNTTSAFNQPLATWDTSSVTNMQGLFGGSAFNQPIGNWDTSKVTTMFGMFSTNGSFNQNIGSWDTSKVTNMGFMFNAATAFDQDLGGWDVTALTNAASMFASMELSIANYDALLIGWNGQTLQSSVTFDGGLSQYCVGEAARNNMDTADAWTITDGGKGCATQTGPNFVVNDADDTDDGSCDLTPGNCTLREAINAANALAGANTITFDIPYAGCAVSSQGASATDCLMSSGAVTPEAAIPSASSCSAANVCTIELASALPTIDENVTIDGSANSADITVSGAGAYPVFFANGGAPLTVIGLAIVDGYTTFHGAGIYAGDALTMTDVLVQNSTSTQTAGGVAAEGPAVITGSTLAGNTANNGGGGGAVFLSTATITNSTFRNNKTDSASHAGGAYFTGAATLGNVTFDSNLAGLAGGGGAVFENTATLTGGVFKNNIASFAGGGAYFNSTATIDATTFYSNSVLANRGGGAYFNGPATVQNALFNGNSAKADRGGGAYFRQDAQITATDFVTNTASNRAGGAYLNATGTLTNTDFYSNTATVRGGGLYLGGAASVLGGVIQGNQCTSVCLGGGAFVASTLVLTDTQFIDNVTDGDGGGALTSANTTMTTALFDGNQSTSVIALSGQSASIVGNTGGGLLHSAGVLNVAGSTFIDNHANSVGGGIGNVNTATANVTNSTFTGNTSGSGGGIVNIGGATLNVTNSTFDGNQALASGDGGGINSLGIANVTNSTFSGNSAGRAGGGIANTGTMTVTNGTVAGNSATNGGGIANNPDPSSPSTTLNNTIVADSATGGDCYVPTGTLAADAFNLDSDGSCDNATQKTVAEINLGPLAPNGGPTETMALLTDSAAIDHAPSASCAAAPVNGLDQRGQPRNLDGNGSASSNECDAGAYEAAAMTAAIPSIIVHKQTLPDGDTTPFQFRLRGPVGRNFTLADNQPHNTGVIPAGVYTLEEVLPPGWDPAIPLSALTCDDGSPLNAINLAADEVLVCRFLNYKRGDIVVKKVALPPVAAPSFNMRLINNTTLAKTFFSLANGQQFDTGAITSVPTYKLLETVPGGWKRKSIVCSNGSVSTAIAVPPGGTVTCTVTNENTPPTNISLSNSSVAENKAIGTLVGNLTTADAVAGDTHTFSFVNDGTPAAANNGNFQIVGKQLKTAKKFDFEQKSSHNIKLMVTDSAGQTKVKAFVIAIVNGPN